MKNIIPILLLYLPLTLLAQNSSEKAGVRERIETAVEQGLITPEQARERYAKFRKKMAQREKTTNH